jgi:hypothetical protein
MFIHEFDYLYLLSDAIVAHAVTNGLIAMQVLFAGHWSLW